MYRKEQLLKSLTQTIFAALILAVPALAQQGGVPIKSRQDSIEQDVKKVDFTKSGTIRVVKEQASKGRRDKFDPKAEVKVTPLEVRKKNPSEPPNKANRVVSRKKKTTE